jgi:hypothetical protein
VSPRDAASGLPTGKRQHGWSPTTGQATEHEVVSPRDAASGLPTGKRQHGAMPIKAGVSGTTGDVVSPRDAASGLPTGKRQHLPIRGAEATDDATDVVSPRDSASGLPTGKRQHGWSPTKGQGANEVRELDQNTGSATSGDDEIPLDDSSVTIKEKPTQNEGGRSPMNDQRETTTGLDVEYRTTTLQPPSKSGSSPTGSGGSNMVRSKDANIRDIYVRTVTTPASRGQGLVPSGHDRGVNVIVPRIAAPVVSPRPTSVGVTRVSPIIKTGAAAGSIAVPMKGVGVPMKGAPMTRTAMPGNMSQLRKP